MFVRKKNDNIHHRPYSPIYWRRFNQLLTKNHWFTLLMVYKVQHGAQYLVHRRKKARKIIIFADNCCRRCSESIHMCQWVKWCYQCVATKYFHNFIIIIIIKLRCRFTHILTVMVSLSSTSHLQLFVHPKQMVIRFFFVCFIFGTNNTYM